MSALSAMSLYLDHFGLNTPPFKITPNTGFFFAGANRGATLEALLYAITQGEGLVKVVGEVGTGKTMLSRMLLEQLPEHVSTVYIATPTLSREEILLVLADELGIPTATEIPERRNAHILRSLQALLIEKYAAGGQVVVLIDEAHAMPAQTLEEIRLLSNLESSQHKLLQIVLFAQPELDERLADPSMRQLRERITYQFKLAPLAAQEIGDYIDFRLRAAGYRGPQPFAAPALKLIASASAGLTRRINILADKAMLSAFAAGRHAITPEDARQAVQDCDFSAAKPAAAPTISLSLTRRTALLSGLGLVAALGLAMTAGWALRPAPAPAPALERSAAPAAVMLPAPAPTLPAAPAVERPVMPEAAPPVPVADSPQDKPSEPPAAALVAAERPYTLQLFYASKKEDPLLQKMRNQAANSIADQVVQILPTQIGAQAVYILALGAYTSREAAEQVRRQLPAELQQYHPQIRSFADLEKRKQNKRQGSTD